MNFIIAVISFWDFAQKLLVNQFDIEAILLIEETKLNENALQIALGDGIIGIFPFLELFNMLGIDAKFGNALLAVLQEILASFNNVFSGGLEIWKIYFVNFEINFKEVF